MAVYVAMRITEGAYTYEYAITKRPDLKAGIDKYLLENGYGNLITA